MYIRVTDVLCVHVYIQTVYYAIRTPYNQHAVFMHILHAYIIIKVLAVQCLHKIQLRWNTEVFNELDGTRETFCPTGISI
jgi:hypothetical protein